MNFFLFSNRYKCFSDIPKQKNCVYRALFSVSHSSFTL